MQSRRLPVFLGSIVLAACGAPSAWGQAVEFERAQLMSAGSVGTDMFGSSACLRGDTLMVCAPAAAALGPNTGEVQWFQYGTPPIYRGTLRGNDVIAADWFGVAVQLDAGRMVVGAGNHAHFGSPTGAAYVFAWNGVTWVEEAELWPFDGGFNDGFGQTVGISGDTIVVGSWGKDEGTNSDEGAAYVFVRVAGTWTFQQKLTSSAHEPGEEFGGRVAIDGDRIAVTSLVGNGGFPNGLGAVSTFHRSGTTWTEDGRLVQPSWSGTYGTFGQGLRVQGDVVAVGHPYGQSPSGSFTGVVHMFRTVGGTWTQEAGVAPPPSYSNGGMLGNSFEFDGDHLVAGCTWFSPFGFASGGVYVFRRDAATWSSFTTTQVLMPAAGNASAWFGDVVTADNAHVVATAHDSKAYLYDRLEPVGAKYCFGDGSGAPCPCGNTSPLGLGMGCANDGFQRGAVLDAAGTSSITAANLECSILGTGSNQEPLILFAATARVGGGAGIAFGDGLRCAGGFAWRYPTQFARSNFGIAVYGPAQLSFGGWGAGDTRYFQGFYRSNGGPCGTGFNLTNAVEITFTP